VSAQGHAHTCGVRHILDNRFTPLARGIGVVVAAATLLTPAAAWACAVCFGSLDNDPFSRGINWGILFMMIMPFTIAGLLGGWLFYVYRPWRRKADLRGKEPLMRPDLTHKESGN
jgi:hypothetical protein